ncbi:MAG: hypothetical protein PHC92_08720 [Syntrophomonadaceae bacterium]|nr:hypothetical protein [Syntrophomonadaceae bacterium]MDD3022763.1 hypothetical protein [Syntrophomonadaceae bacterium]
MSNENENDSRTVLMFNPYTFWKKYYFSGEDTLSAVTRKSVETSAFANGVDVILNAYLQYLRMNKEITSSLTDKMPFASKHDMARVAKLVITLENKIDRLEDSLFDEIEELKEQSTSISNNLSAQSKPGHLKDDGELHEKFDKAFNTSQEMLKRISGIEEAVQELKKVLETINMEAKPVVKKSRKSPSK